MKHALKSLRSNGIYVPPYDYIGFNIKIREHPVKLNPKSEQMAVAWIRKLQSPTTSPDEVFCRNFMHDFLEQLRLEYPSLDFLQVFSAEYIKSMNSDNSSGSCIGKFVNTMEIDFSEISEHLSRERFKKLNLAKIEKKQLAEERKAQREALREKFGYAVVDGKEIEIANWTAEPSCIFAGRGNHPRRGKWKEGPKEEDIILNLSPGSPTPPGNWKSVVWEPDKMYIAKWQDKISGKIKYVWFSDSAFFKQNREREKFKKAERLGRIIPKIEEHIMENLDSKDDERRKLATVCWLILKLNMRVGDEKDPGEADTVGAITLRPEHIEIEDNILHFDFLGKDSVRWTKSVEALPVAILNIKHYSKTCREYLFEGTDSRKVSRFLSEKMAGLTAKVFRTWRCTTTVKEYLENCKVKKSDPEHLKNFHARVANLRGAEVANHKRKVPPNFDEKMAKKMARLKELKLKLEEKRRQGKKTDSILARIEKTKLDAELTKLTREYNLGTSLKSYIDPAVFMRWAEAVDFSLEKFYPKTLRKKFSWALKAKIE